MKHWQFQIRFNFINKFGVFELNNIKGISYIQQDLHIPIELGGSVHILIEVAIKMQDSFFLVHSKKKSGIITLFMNY